MDPIGHGRAFPAVSVAAAGASPLGASYTAPTKIIFGYSDGDISVNKTFTFDHDSYVVGVQTDVEVKGVPVSAFPMWPSGFGADITGAQYALGQIIYQNDDKVERLAIKKVSGGGTVPGPFNWAGISDQYFAAVFRTRLSSLSATRSPYPTAAPTPTRWIRSTSSAQPSAA